MLKKITYFILLTVAFGCKEKSTKKNNVYDFLYKKPDTEEIVRPIKVTFLEKESDSIKNVVYTSEN